MRSHNRTTKTCSQPIPHFPLGKIDHIEPEWMRMIFTGQARLLAERAGRGLLITSGSLQRLLELGERLARIAERAA